MITFEKINTSKGRLIIKTLFLLVFIVLLGSPVAAQEDSLTIGSTFDAEASDISLQHRKPPFVTLSGHLKTQYKANRPGVGYDAEVQWIKAGPTGFGRYESLSMAEAGPNAQFDPLGGGQPQIFKNSGTLLTLAGGGGRGGLWKRSTSGGGWKSVKGDLPAPYHHVAAAINPQDKDHIIAVIPKNREALSVYETKDGGQNWSEMSYFSQSGNTLNNETYANVLSANTSTDIHFFKNGAIFIYNFKGDSWGYYYSPTDDKWQHSNLNVDASGKPYAENRIYFSANGNGLLNPTGGEIYRTTDYGKSWTQIADYSEESFRQCRGGCEGLSFAVSDDGQSVYVLYKQAFTLSDSLNEDLNGGEVTEDLVEVFGDNGADLKKGENVKVKDKSSNWKVFNGDFRWNLHTDNNQIKVRTCCYLETSTDGGKNFDRRNLSKPFPGKGTQGLVVDPDDPSKLTAFIYMDGPFVSTDQGKSWTQIYYNASVQKKVWHTHFYDTKTIRKDGPEDGMARPEDFRDVMVMDEYEDNPILIGSDQGLFVMSHPKESISPTVFWNVGSGMDNTEVYGVEVDDCGNLYHGLWHHSAMIRSKSSSNKITHDELYYYGGIPESGALFMKDKSQCLSWSSINADKNGPNNFRNYLSNKSGTLKKHDSEVTYKYKGTPVFSAGEWQYIDKKNWNLYSASLSKPSYKKQLANNVNWLKKDRPSGSLWYISGYGHLSKEPENIDGSPNPQKLIKLHNLRLNPNMIVSSSIATSLDLSDSYIEPSLNNGYDVYNERVAIVVKDGSRQDILIYNHSNEHTVTGSDIPFLDNPFTEQFEEPVIQEVWVDPTDPDRYFASVKNESDEGAQCPFHLMATEDKGQTWEVFSEYLDCTNVYDVAINSTTETMYVATHARGVLKGNLGNLQETTDLSVDLSCEDDIISETGAINCNLKFKMNGEAKKSWENATNSVQVDVNLPYDDYLYEFRTSNRTLREAGCIANYKKDAKGFRKVKSITCRSLAQQDSEFPESGLLLKLKMNRNYTKVFKDTAFVSAYITINTAPQDLLYRNDRDSTSFIIYDKIGYKKDRFDPHISDKTGRVISNDNLSSAAKMRWTHNREYGHMRCIGSYPDDKNCAGILTNPSSDVPKEAAEIWSVNLRDLDLTSSGDDDYYKIPMPEIHSPLMKDKLSQLECGTNTIELTPSEGNRPDSKKKKGDDPVTGYSTSLLFTLDENTYKPYFKNAKPKGYTLRKIHADLKAAFENEGVALSNRARIRTPEGVNDWKNSPRWRILDQGDTYIVEPVDGVLNVYSASPKSTNPDTKKDETKTVTRTIHTKGWLHVSVEPNDNSLAQTAVNPDFLELNAYRTADPESRLAGGEHVTDSDEIALRIDCPQSRKNLDSLYVSVGEDDLTAGGYNLRLMYRIKMSREEPMETMSGTLEKNTRHEKPAGPAKSAASEDNTSLTLMPRGGLSLPGVSSLGDITGEAGATLEGGQSVLTWGGSIAFGSRDGFAGFRLTGLHRSGTITTTLVNDELTTTEVDESFTAFTADLELRPIPRLLVQPYATGGFGFRKITHGNSDVFQMDNSWKSVAQLGAGVDIPLGNEGVILGVEVTDYISNFSREGGVRHDAFVFSTVGIPLF